MQISLFPQFFFISILLSAIISNTNFTHAHNQCLDDQKTLLLELKKELIFNPSLSTKLVQWNQTQTDDCCSWEGVECDAAGHVIGLQLDKETISGGIDENSSSLFGLRFLKKLNLAWNEFDGIQIPRGIGNLTYLTHLNLSNAAFGGQVPSELSLLRRLVSLDLSCSYFARGGQMEYTRAWSIQALKLEHPNLKMLLQNLTGLRELFLESVDFSAQKGEWYQVISSSLPDLRNLSLRFCSLPNPPDPYLSQFRSLTVLGLAGNNLSTVVPVFFANFSSLTALSLSNCSLKGSLGLSNNFYTLFQRLSKLYYLDLRHNFLSGNIPQSFFRGFPNLVYLYLGYNSLSGSIPQTLFQGLSSLAYLDLGYNSLSGGIPQTLFQGLSSLVYLDLGYNSLNGSIPQSLFGLPSLEFLSLHYNQFSGRVFEFPALNFSNMRSLSLMSNRLEGPIPESFFQLESLENLELSYNFFNGIFQLEEKIQRLPYLAQLDLSHNNLSVDASRTNSSSSTFPQLHLLGLASCNLYHFPYFIKQSKYWEYLDLSNNGIAGEIPSWIWEVGNGTLYYLNLSSNLLVDLQKPYRIPSSVQTLDLHSNQLRGELPLPPQQAYYVDYSSNNFDKTIPLNFIISDSNVTFLSLANNSLNGSVPTSICNAKNLGFLDLSVNKLSGNIPPCLLENIEYLEVFNLGKNNISGVIPDKFSINCRLRTLDLTNNNLGGNIPKSLENCKSLTVMNVGYNHINDSFPCKLPSSLRVLVLRCNKFHGEVKCHNSWPNLHIIDIASNNFSGNLHSINFSSWRGMMLDNSDAQLRRNHSGFNPVSQRDYYRVDVTLTIKGLELELQLFMIRVDFISIDFSCNNFQGEIPNAIGDLSSLHHLNLSHNAFVCTIPKSLGKLMQLESLDLSVNQLIGKIPTELGKLTFLSALNLSYNKLVGVIPNGPQFLTFSADSFKGNTELCGFPLNISCSGTDQLNDLPPLKLKNVEIEWDYVAAALGYAVGLGIFFWSLLYYRSLREKIDEVVENVFDRQEYRRRRVLRNRVRRP